MWHERIPILGPKEPADDLKGVHRKPPFMDLFVSLSLDNLIPNSESIMESKANLCGADTPCVIKCVPVPASPAQSAMCVMRTFAYVHSPLPPSISSPLLGLYVRGKYHQEDDQEEDDRSVTIPGLAMFPELFLSPGHLLGVVLTESGPKCVVICFYGSKNVQFHRCDGLHNLCHTFRRLDSSLVASICVGRVRISREILGSSSSSLPLAQRFPGFFSKGEYRAESHLLSLAQSSSVLL